MSTRPPATLLYLFDDPARFPVFVSHTTVKGPVTVQADRDAAGGFLRIAYQRQDADLNEGTIVLALPLMAVDGNPRQLLFEVLGDAGPWRLTLEGMDANGGRVLFSFGVVDLERRCVLRADASQSITPLQFHRLRLAVPFSSAVVRLGLRSVFLTGAVRLVPPGLAQRRGA